ncbi:uncharacterized protein [Rutidosis leptorrhynchoides]|uniref:uncharacterized protein n=1 Tax=Rutidosis leptorrhynchoides TaxID=125765 RepID=UPI003A9A4366
MSLVTPQIRAIAEICYGDAICQEQIKLQLEKMGLPNGLLPVKDIEECGYVKDTGFVWIRQKKPSKNNNEKIGKISSYATEITGYMEKFKIKKLTGVKSKELLIWIQLTEASINDQSTDKITFWTSSGIHKSYPVSAFQVDDEKKNVESECVVKDAQVKEI